MTNIEAYNSMIDGFAVSHKLFSPDEFLYMDENHIIRDEKGEEYETTWDVKSQMDQFKTDWYIIKNRGSIDQIILANKIALQGGPDALPYIEDANYQDAIARETIDNKFIRSLPLDENGNQLEFSNQDGLYIESTQAKYTCNRSYTCKRYLKDGPIACTKCNKKLYDTLTKLDLIIEMIILVMILVLVTIDPIIPDIMVLNIIRRVLYWIAYINLIPSLICLGRINK